MASVVERQTEAGERRLFVVFRATDCDPKSKKYGEERQFWVRCPVPKKKAAEELRDNIAVGLRQNGGLWPLEAPKESDELTVRTYAARWLKSYAAGNVRERTRDSYEASLRLHVLPLLGDRLLSSVTPLEGKELVAAMREAGRSDNTIKNAVTPLREMLGHAAEDRLITANPLAGVRLFGNRKRAPRKVQPPTREQVEAIIAAAKREDARDAIRVAAATGLRRGELFALVWSDADFEARTIHVHATNYAGKISDETKTEAGERHVPLFRSIRQLLLERKARQRFSDADDFVFGSIVGTPMDPGNFVRREFRPALRAAGLEGFRWHDLRHYAVSALIAEGADIKLLQAIAGHSTATVTLDVYGHLMRERVTEAADRFDPMGVSTAAGAPR